MWTYEFDSKRQRLENPKDEAKIPAELKHVRAGLRFASKATDLFQEDNGLTRFWFDHASEEVEQIALSDWNGKTGNGL